MALSKIGSSLLDLTTDLVLTGTTPSITIGDAGAEDSKLVFDGNAQDFYIALDDSVDDLLIGKGSTVGTTPAIAITEDLLVTVHGGLTMAGTTPTLTIGDAGAEDTKIVFDGNAQDFYIGLDDSADDLLIGLGSAVGTTPAISIDENLKVTLAGDLVVSGDDITMATNTSGAALIADGTNFNPVAVSGDVTISNAGAVTIANNAVEQAMIADDAVGADQLAANSVVSASIVNGSIVTADLADNSITSAKIVNGTIVAADIANNAILTQHIDDNQITGDQLADDLVLSGTGAIRMPDGTTAQRPGSAAAGMFRYNTTLGKFEGYTDAWGEIGGGGANTFSRQAFTGDGSAVAFTLSQTPDSENNLIVFIEGVFQDQDAYSVSGTTLTMADAPLSGRGLVVYHVSAAVAGAGMAVNTMTGDNSDTTLTLAVAPGHVNNVQVFFDGVYQKADTYTVSGTTLTFGVAPPTGVLVEARTHSQTAINTFPATGISGLTAVTPVPGDHMMILDATDDALKKADVKDIMATAVSITSAADAVAMTFDSSENATFSANVTVTGDLTVTGDDITMATNTAGHLLVGDGTNYNPVAVSGAATLAANGTVTIANNAILTQHIDDNQVTADQIAAATITTTQIAANTIATGNVADNAIDGTKIAQNSILTRHIDDAQVTADQLAADSVITAKILDANVTSGKIANNAILTQHIDDNQVTADQIADTTVTATQIANATITTTQIAANTIATGNVADNAIDGTKIASNSILTRHIDDNQITTDQIAANTIATANIADNAVDGTKIASNSILTRHIDDDQITGDQLADAVTFTTSATAPISISTTSARITQVALTSSSNAVAWDSTAAANAYHTTTENTTFSAPSNSVEGAIISVEIAQGGTARTIAWNTVFEFAASTAPTITATANKTDILAFRYNGSVWQEIGRVQNMAQT